MRITIKKSFLALQIIIMLYCAGGIALFYLQDKILFPQLHETKKQAFTDIAPAHVMTIPINNEDTIHLYQFVPTDDTVSKGLVIFLHGGDGSVVSYANRVDDFLRLNYEVWMPEYAYVENQDKSFSTDDISTAAVQAYTLSKVNDAAARRVVVYGQSMGVIGAATIARMLSGENKNKVRIILENPFSSMADLLDSKTYIYPWSAMCKYKSNPLADFKESEVKLSYCTGDNGEIYSQTSSEKYRALLKTPQDELKLTTEKGKRINESQAYKNWLAKLLN